MRKWTTLLFVAPLVLGLALFSVWLSGPRVSRGTYARVQNGMTEAQVENVLGEGRPRDVHDPKWRDREGRAKEYQGELYSIVVWYDPAGRVSSKAHFGWIYRRQEPLRFRIRDALGLVDWDIFDDKD
ncbi:MAG: hypothetical protein U0793_12185 [Gemmataceae bacterium]